MHLTVNVIDSDMGFIDKSKVKQVQSFSIKLAVNCDHPSK